MNCRDNITNNVGIHNAITTCQISVDDVVSKLLILLTEHLDEYVEESLTVDVGHDVTDSVQRLFEHLDILWLREYFGECLLVALSGKQC